MAPSPSTAAVSEADICDKYIPLIEGMVQRLRVPHALCEDARQEGFIGLLEAVRRYDASSPVHFSVFAKPYVKGAVLRRTYTRTQVTETAAEDPRAGHPLAGGKFEIEPSVVRAVHLGAWMATLPLAEAWLLRRIYWDDADSDQVAAELGVTRRRVNQIHKSLLRQGAIALGEKG